MPAANEPAVLFGDDRQADALQALATAWLSASGVGDDPGFHDAGGEPLAEGSPWESDATATFAVRERTLLAHLNELESTTGLREKYAACAYRLATGSISFWIVVVGAVGVTQLASGRQALSDTVLVAVTTGCTVNVLAAFLGVIRGLFPSATVGGIRKRND